MVKTWKKSNTKPDVRKTNKRPDDSDDERNSAYDEHSKKIRTLCASNTPVKHCSKTAYSKAMNTGTREATNMANHFNTHGMSNSHTPYVTGSAGTRLPVTAPQSIGNVGAMHTSYGYSANDICKSIKKSTGKPKQTAPKPKLYKKRIK